MKEEEYSGGWLSLFVRRKRVQIDVIFLSVGGEKQNKKIRAFLFRVLMWDSAVLGRTTTTRLLSFSSYSQRVYII